MVELNNRMSTSPAIGETFFTLLETIGLQWHRNSHLPILQALSRQPKRRLSKQPLVQSLNSQSLRNFDSTATNKNSVAQKSSRIYHLTLLVRTILETSYWTTYYAFRFLKLFWNANKASNKPTQPSSKDVKNKPIDHVATEIDSNWDKNLT